MGKITKNIIIAFIISFSATIAFGDEIQERKKIMREVKSLFLNDKYKDLDLISENYRNSQERTGSGLWKLTFFYTAFGKLNFADIKNKKYWDNLTNKINLWVKLYPKSPTAIIVKGIILREYAWKYRGVEYADNVPKEAWKPFKRNLNIAHDYIINNKNIGASDPHWYVITADIKLGINGKEDSFIKLVDEGLNQFPYYYQLYFTAIEYLTPKWHGNKAKIEAYAVHAVRRTSSKDKMGMYARIYWYAADAYYGNDLFYKSSIVWSKMKKGIFDIIKAYPDAWNIQKFAFFSCLRGDKNTLNILMRKIIKPMIENVWRTQKYYDSCRKFSL